MTPEQKFAQLSELAATVPVFGVNPNQFAISRDAMTWYGRLHAILELNSLSIEAMELKQAWGNLGTILHSRGVTTIHSLLYGALHREELSLPVAARGAFIGAGNHFDALAAIGKILRQTSGTLFVIDPYLNERFLTDFASMVPLHTPIRLLGGAKGVDGTLQTAVERWNAQFKAERPVEARLARKGVLHDRLMIDDHHAWVLGQSFKDFANKSPGSILRADPELTALKRDAFQLIWDDSTPL